MLKKYLYEKNQLIKTLRGGQFNCLNLTETEVPSEALEKYRNSAEIKEKLSFLMEEGR